jgi:4-amino-4-deoxy-L-arabinose transferase-like glycosyltransferase
MKSPDCAWSHRRSVAMLFGGILIVRLLVIFFCPTDLAGDEAYYWEWGQHPAWGYYSKPPGIAWIMGLARWLGSDSVIAIRLTATAFSMGTGLAIYLLACHLFNRQTGLLAAALFFVTPAAAGIGFLLTIDSPLMFFWSSTLYFFSAPSMRNLRRHESISSCWGCVSGQAFW